MAFSATSLPLHQQTCSLDHWAWVGLLATTPNLLVIQDLDGVCMGLMAEPLDRQIDLDYGQATQAFEGIFTSSLRRLPNRRPATSPKQRLID
jgi:glucosylglycerol 3-phosphatase